MKPAGEPAVRWWAVPVIVVLCAVLLPLVLATIVVYFLFAAFLHLAI